MIAAKSKPTSIDQYISQFSPSVQTKLKELRKTIIAAAPEAEEKISYQMPAFAIPQGTLVYFGAYENHIGFYPTASGIANFQKEIEHYKSSKGAIQFPIGEPLPLDLVTKIVTFRVADCLKRAKARKAGATKQAVAK